MKVKLYVNWQDEEILKEKEYEEKILEAAKDREENDDYDFSDFLDDYLDRNHGCCRSEQLAYLFRMNEEERKKILELWKVNCLEVARINFPNDYKVIEIEV